MLFNKKKKHFVLTVSSNNKKRSNIHFTYLKCTKNITIHQNTIIKKDQFAFNKKILEVGMRKVLTIQQQYFKSHPDFTTQYFTTLSENKKVYLMNPNHNKNSTILDQKELNQWQNKFNDYDSKIEQLQKIINDLKQEKEVMTVKPSIMNEDIFLQKGQTMLRKRLRYEAYRKGNAK